MKSYVTSYNNLFSRNTPDTPRVDRIEIPIIQRDYAQGRLSDLVARIRANFLDALHGAVTTSTSITLDFVYGDVVDGTLRPLDGQQRLTTLFLLHWYFAWRAGTLDLDLGWKRFEYATRPSARRFCECLVQSNPPSESALSYWIKDQAWFLHTWRHDPTIDSMLVMLEAIHQKFADVNHSEAWGRLVSSSDPAITFHLLPIEKMGLSEDLYIKMNSRGKPLTEFENFKARFEGVLERSVPHRVEEFARKVDGAWADVLWPLRGSNNIVDEEFLNYFQFITDICEWRDQRFSTGTFEARAERVFGSSNERAADHLDFLIQCFDTWKDVDSASVFAETFSLKPVPLDSHDLSKVVLYVAQLATVDLFSDCCKGRARLSWPRILLLYAVLLHRLNETSEFPRRLRVLRNLIEASGNELRSSNMPLLLAEVRSLIVDGDLETIETFNQGQVADEKLKSEMLRQHPGLEVDLFHLEDHPLLRGCLVAFELDPAVFARRAKAFHEVFSDTGLLRELTGAMLAVGDYSRPINHRFRQFGSSEDRYVWRAEILSGMSRANSLGVRDSLGKILDVVAEREGDIRSALQAFQQSWLQNSPGERNRDWRWYFVRYPEMRQGRSGIYASAVGSLSYDVCMLDKQAMSSYYRDPYLSAIKCESGVPANSVSGAVWEDWSNGPWFTGYETAPRWMRLNASGIQIRSVAEGISLDWGELNASQDEAFSRVCAAHKVAADGTLRIPQVAAGDMQVDVEDRVQLGALLLRDLVAAGL